MSVPTCEIVVPEFGDIVTYVDLMGVERRGIMEAFIPEDGDEFALFLVSDDDDNDVEHRWGYMAQITQINGINTFPQDR